MIANTTIWPGEVEWAVKKVGFSPRMPSSGWLIAKVASASR